MDRNRASRGWRRASAVAAAVAVAALVALGFWVAGQPGESAGTPLADVRAATLSPPTASPSPTTASPSPTTSSSPTPPPSRTASPSASAAKPPTGKPPTSRAPTSKARALPRATARDASINRRDTSAASAPVRLVIPDLGVDAAVDDVGVRKDGAMVIPTGSRVGWYRYGSAPGDAHGNTVIAGHVATGEDGAGAMAPLRKAQPGMRVIVTTGDGADHEYEVKGRQAIVKKRLPVDEIFARDGRPLLVLITCGGEYIPELRSHRDNIVVTAAPVG